MSTIFLLYHSSVIIVMAPAIVIPVLIEEIISVFSVMMVRPMISGVTLFTAIMSICHVGMRILSDFSQ